MGIAHLKQRVHAYLTRNKALILTYHGVLSTPLDFEIWTHIPLRSFEQQMEYLGRNSHVISLNELANGIKNNSLPENAVVLTFDDGFLSNYICAYPVLKRLNLPATIFLSTGFLNSGALFWPEHLAYLILKSHRSEIEYRQTIYTLNTALEKSSAFASIRNGLKLQHPGDIGANLIVLEGLLGVVPERSDPFYEALAPMDWEQVHEMDSDPLISFGGHTSNHTILTRLSAEEVLTEVVDCRADLDRHLAQSTNLWAYPNGTLNDFSSVHRELLIDEGFDVIVTTEQEYIDGDSDSTQLGRWGVGPNYDMRYFRRIVHKCNWLRHVYCSNRSISSFRRSVRV
jgi:peptidoglycan/xylan/chitin deacetylase (PgdA/CDA1 family)